MTEADVIQPSASIASTGKGIRYIGQHCYGYSGTVVIGAVQSQFYPMLEFTGGSGYIIGKLQIGSNVAGGSSGDNFELKLELNGIAVMIAEAQQVPQTEPMGYVPWDILIPPFTKTTFSMANVANADATDWFMILTGRVYGAT